MFLLNAIHLIIKKYECLQMTRQFLYTDFLDFPVENKSVGCLVGLLITFSACKKERNNEDRTVVLSAFKTLSTDPGELTFYALRNGSVLDKYSTLQLENTSGSTSITGLGTTTILAIDFRPKTNQLFGLGNNNRVYIIDPTSGAATLTPELFTTANKLPPVDATTQRIPVTVEGSMFGFDFNPAADRLRIVSNTGQSLRINVETGFTIIDGAINPQPATITGVAYDDNDNDPATTTELYALDMQSQKLFEIDPPNNGTLVEEGPTKLTLKGEGGFDIAPRRSGITTDIGLAVYEENSKSTLFRINADTGETTLLVKYSSNLMYTGIAISPL